MIYKVITRIHIRPYRHDFIGVKQGKIRVFKPHSAETSFQEIYCKCWDSNPRLLGEKREHYLCAILSPPYLQGLKMIILLVSYDEFFKFYKVKALIHSTTHTYKIHQVFARNTLIRTHLVLFCTSSKSLHFADDVVVEIVATSFFATCSIQSTQDWDFWWAFEIDAVGASLWKLKLKMRMLEKFKSWSIELGKNLI